MERHLTVGLVYSAKMDLDAVWKSQCWAGLVMLLATHDQVLGIIFIYFFHLSNSNLSPSLGDSLQCLIRFTPSHVLSYHLIIESYLYLIWELPNWFSWHSSDHFSSSFIELLGNGIFQYHFTISFWAQEYAVVPSSYVMKFKLVRYSSAIFDFIFGYIYFSSWPHCY